MRTQRKVGDRYELYSNGVFVSRKKSEGPYKGVEIESDVTVTIGDESLVIDMESLMSRRGAYKTVVNKVVPFVLKVLRGIKYGDS